MRTFMGLAAVTAATALGAGSASAATAVGNECEGAGPLPATATFVQVAEAPGNPLPLAVPTAGVITRWQVDNGYSEGLSEKLKVFRQGSPGLQVVGESSLEALPLGTHTFETRIPVQTGDRIGVFGDLALIACPGTSGDVVEAFEGDVPVGSEGTFFGTAPNYKAALVAFVEPDADGDGYGDETQDKCVRSAATHGECPSDASAIALRLDAFPVVLKRSVLLLVSANATSSVTVSGKVSWKAAKPGARSSKVPRKPKAKGTIAKLRGGTRTVEGGSIGRFNVKLPGSVKKQLARLPRGKSIKGTLTASSIDAAGKRVSHTVTIRLHGWQKKGKPRK